MYKQYGEQLKSFFQTYGVQRREWVALAADWKERGENKEKRAQIEALMAQVEEYHTALNALLVQSSVDSDRVSRLYKEMMSCYKELVQLTKPVWRQFVEDIVKVAFAAFIIRTFLFGIYHVPTGSAEPNILVGDRLWGNKAIYMMYKPAHGDLVIFNNPEFVYSNNPLEKWWQKYVGIGLFGFFKQGPDNWVKRTIAVPGDTIEGRMENGKTVLYRNGEKLEETNVNPYPLLTLRKETGFFAPHSILGCLLPSFLHKRTCPVRYSYDPSVSLENQPFYHMLPHEVVRHPLTGDPIMYPAFEPCVEDRSRRNVDVFGPLVVPAGKYWVQGDSRRNSRDSRYWMFLDEEHLLGRASIVLFSFDSEEPFWLFALLKDPVGFFTHVVRWNRFLKPLWGMPDIRIKEVAGDKE